MRAGWLWRAALAVAVGVLAYVVLNSFGNDDSGGSGGTESSASANSNATQGRTVGQRFDTVIDQLSNRQADCQVPVSSACATLMQDVTIQLSSVKTGLDSSGTDTDYSDALADISSIQDGVDLYMSSGCSQPGLPGADATPPSENCASATTQAMVGLGSLRAKIDMAEQKAG